MTSHFGKTRFGAVAGVCIAAAALTACASGGGGDAATMSAQAATAGPVTIGTGSLIDTAPIRALTPEQNRARSEAYLAQVGTQPGVQTTASGLRYRIDRRVSEDTPRPTPADVVAVHYEGRLIDGQVFDSSYERGEPAQFPLGGVIPGWTEGLQLLRPGEAATLWIPQELGYGSRGAGDGEIPAYSALVFRVELLGIQRPDGTTVP